MFEGMEKLWLSLSEQKRALLGTLPDQQAKASIGHGALGLQATTTSNQKDNVRKTGKSLGLPSGSLTVTRDAASVHGPSQALRWLLDCFCACQTGIEGGPVRLVGSCCTSTCHLSSNRDNADGGGAPTRSAVRQDAQGSSRRERGRQTM